MRSKNLDMEYSTIVGVPEFNKAAINLALGEGNPWVKEGLVSSIFRIFPNNKGTIVRDYNQML